MKFLLEFDFTADPRTKPHRNADRIANVLRKAADVIVQNGDLDGVVADADGVIVGHYTLTKRSK